MNPGLSVLNSCYSPIIFKEIFKPFLMLPVIIPLYLNVDEPFWWDTMKKIQKGSFYMSYFYYLQNTFKNQYYSIKKRQGICFSQNWITGKFINLLAKGCYLSNFFLLCWEGLRQQDQVTVNKTKISNPSKKHNPSNKHMIYTTTLLFITPMENFTTFNVENPVYEITTHIFIQDECTHLLLDYILVRSLLLISLSFLPYSHKIWGTV